MTLFKILKEAGGLCPGSITMIFPSIKKSNRGVSYFG